MKGLIQPGTANKSRRHSGFTLIELLVVIAIIALLAAILLPVFQAARERARMSSCASNEKQIGIALMQYNQDYDELMPFISMGQIDRGPGDSYPGYTWQDEIYPYLKSAGVFNCPSTNFNWSSTADQPYAYSNPALNPNGVAVRGTWLGTPAGGMGHAVGSYWISACYQRDGLPPVTSISDTNGSGAFSGCSAATPCLAALGKLQSPSTTFWVGENDGGGGGTGLPGIVIGLYKGANDTLSLGASSNPTAGQVLVGSRTGGAIGFPHIRRSNVLFCDGHVKGLAPADFLVPSSQAGYLLGFTSWGQ